MRVQRQARQPNSNPVAPSDEAVGCDHVEIPLQTTQSLVAASSIIVERQPNWGYMYVHIGGMDESELQRGASTSIGSGDGPRSRLSKLKQVRDQPSITAPRLLRVFPTYCTFHPLRVQHGCRKDELFIYLEVHANSARRTRW